MLKNNMVFIMLNSKLDRFKCYVLLLLILISFIFIAYSLDVLDSMIIPFLMMNGIFAIFFVIEMIYGH